jgi:colicin import membrane protein
MRPSPPSSSEQEFPYGWRFVKRTQPDGSETWDQVPLTLEDALHPQEDDVIPVNTDHDTDCTYLETVFRDRPLEPPLALVTCDVLVNWGVEGIRNHSPDVAVFVGLGRDPRPTGLVELAELGGRCELVVEVVSPNRRDNDVVAKFDHYCRVGIPVYVIVDQEKENGPRFLRAYRRRSDRYVEIESDDQFRVELPLLGLMIGLRDNHPICYDLRTHEELGDYSQIVREREEAKRERDLAKQRLEDADRRAEQQEKAIEEQVDARQQAERKAADAQKEADRAQKEAEKQREEAEKQREEADRQRRARDELENQKKRAEDRAAQRIRDLEEMVRGLQAGGAENPTA